VQRRDRKEKEKDKHLEPKTLPEKHQSKRQDQENPSWDEHAKKCVHNGRILNLVAVGETLGKKRGGGEGVTVTREEGKKEKPA